MVDKKILEKAYNMINKYIELPLGNSDVQNLFLIQEDQYSLGRKARTYFVNLWSKIQIFEENYYKVKKSLIEIEKLEYEINKTEDVFDKRIKEIELEEKKNNLKYIYKLFLDCYREIEVLTYALENLPDVSRDEYEMQEIEHFKEKLVRSLTSTAQERSLKTIGLELTDSGIKTTDNYKNIIKNLSEYVNSSKINYRDSLTNIQNLNNFNDVKNLVHSICTNLVCQKKEEEK